MSSIKSSLKNFFKPIAAPRLLLFLPAVLFKLLSSLFSTIGYVLHNGPMAVAGMVFWVIWIAVLFLIAVPATDRLLKGATRWLKPFSIILVTLLALVGIIEYGIALAVGAGVNVPNFIGPNTAEVLENQQVNLSYNDATALCHQAVDNLLAGKNPYSSPNIITADLRFNGANDPWTKTTPIRTGRFAADFPYPSNDELKAVWDQAVLNPLSVPPEFESELNYPAGCFLLPAPLVWLGVGDLRWIYLFAMVAALAFAVIKAPAGTRFWLIGGALASLEIWESIASGETGIIVFPFLLGAWLLWRKHTWLSAVCMGVAVATKQVAWFYMLFYLVLLVRTLGWEKTGKALLISGGVFVAFNGIFIIQNPALWLNSLLAPMADKLFPLGVGPVTLVINGYINTRSTAIFGAMEISALFAGIAWYWWYFRRFPNTGIILSVVPLFFAWRSAWWYFFSSDIILLAVVCIEDYSIRVIPPNPSD
jgi:hypothetical protein